MTMSPSRRQRNSDWRFSLHRIALCAFIGTLATITVVLVYINTNRRRPSEEAMNWALAVCEANAPSSNEEAWKFIGGIWLTPYRRYQSVGLFVADSLRWCSDDEYKEVGAQLIRAGFQKEARLMLACRYDPIEIWRDHFDVVAIRLYRGLPSGVALGGIRSIEDFIALGNLNLPAQK